MDRCTRAWPAIPEVAVTEADAARIASLLQEIRDAQRLQLERQAEALALQRDQFALVQKSQERAEKLQTRAEAMQDRSAQMIARSRKALAFVVPLVVLVVIVLAICGMDCSAPLVIYIKTKRAPSIGAALRGLNNVGIVPAAAIRDSSPRVVVQSAAFNSHRPI